jgi:hypothetical protein
MSLFGGQTLEVGCDVDIEKTQASFHAYAVPDGVDIRPGDRVMVHGAPTTIGFGEHVSFRSTATVIRAGWFGRLAVKISQFFELTELYEVGFQPVEELASVTKSPSGNAAHPVSWADAPAATPAAMARSAS